MYPGNSLRFPGKLAIFQVIVCPDIALLHRHDTPVGPPSTTEGVCNVATFELMRIHPHNPVKSTAARRAGAPGQAETASIPSDGSKFGRIRFDR